MLRKYLYNCFKPEGRFGAWVLKGMNKGHAALASWGLNFFDIQDGQRILDIGCGGGANIARLLHSYPSSLVDGIDHSLQSVLVSKQLNQEAIIMQRCHIYQADVQALPLEDSSYERVIAIETVYFWPDIIKCFKEVQRVLSKGGSMLIVCEMSDPIKGQKWSKYCEQMKIYKPQELKKSLEAAGFENIIIHEKGTWLAIIATKT
ncbi:MAG: class I SAM-dependent methyltransferase [Erysipelotrichaceae bacterium]|nr:class I SAM-dependent methyltransferase [Erysipelotrichaceae bacterium]MDY5251412.1 class I SAM-dependent methyltransferase [Erysipelotrichaceae bacterium]